MVVEKIYIHTLVYIYIYIYKSPAYGGYIRKFHFIILQGAIYKVIDSRSPPQKCLLYLNKSLM